MVKDIGRVDPCRRRLPHERRRERNGNAESRRRRFFIIRRRDDNTRRLYVSPHLVGVRKRILFPDFVVVNSI